MSLHSLIVHTNSIVSAASKAVTFQRRATRLDASVPPLRCRHPARASRAPLSKKLRFCFGRLHFIPAACAKRPRLRCVQSLRFLSLPIGKFSVLPRLSFWALVCLRLLHIAAASARCQPFPSGNPRLPSSSSRFVLIKLFSFFLGSRLRLNVYGSKAKASAPFSTPFRGSGFRIPMGTLGIQTASLRASLAQAFAHNVSSPPAHPFRGHTSLSVSAQIRDLLVLKELRFFVD